ncbi:MAG: nuclear transport factor 2 family protein [Acidimicrobiales bacterium]
MSGMSDEAAIRRTLAAYCQFCDDGRFDEWGALFAEDASFRVLGRSHEGRAAIQAFIAAAQPPERRGKHVCANPLIDVDGDTARAVTDYIFLSRIDGGGLAVSNTGRYHDRLVRRGDRWLFAERSIVFMGEAS